MATGFVVPIEEPQTGKRAYASVPRGSVIPWVIPPEDTTGVVSDYFDLVTGLGLAGTSVDGWRICNGGDSTVDMTDRYPRAYGEGTETLGSLLEQQTAPPSSSFATGSKTVTVNGSGSIYSANVDDNYMFYHTSYWESDSGSGIGSGSSYKYPLVTNDSYSIVNDDLTHNHTVTFYGNSYNVGSQPITTGGDSETRPDSITVLFITYTGELQASTYSDEYSEEYS